LRGGGGREGEMKVGAESERWRRGGVGWSEVLGGDGWAQRWDRSEGKGGGRLGMCIRGSQGGGGEGVVGGRLWGARCGWGGGAGKGWWGGVLACGGKGWRVRALEGGGECVRGAGGWCDGREVGGWEMGGGVAGGGGRGGG